MTPETARTLAPVVQKMDINYIVRYPLDKSFSTG